jgi:hypothetical protein
MSALCLGTGNVTTQHAEWRCCVNIGSCTTRVCHQVCFHICDFSMDLKLEQRANIKFCMKPAKSGVKTFEMIRRAYRNEAMSRTRCFECHACFKRGRTSLEDNERSGRPSTNSAPKNVETIWQFVHEDHQRTSKDIATFVNVLYGTVQTILTCDLNMHCVAAKASDPWSERAPCCNLSRASSVCRGWPILHVEGHHWGRELGLWVWSQD